MQKLKQQQLFDRVLEKLPDHVTLLLVIFSGFLLARLTWMLFPADPSLMVSLSETKAEQVEVINANTNSQQLGQEIAAYHLLGRYTPPAEPTLMPAVQQVEVVTPPPKPREPIKLVGVYALPGNAALAMIDVRGEQHVVGIGEPVGETNAKLEKVFADRIEVSWDGEKQEVKLPMLEASHDAAQAAPDADPEYFVEPAIPQYKDPAMQKIMQQDISIDPSTGVPIQPDRHDGRSHGDGSAGVSVPNQSHSQPTDVANGQATSLGSFRQQIMSDNTKLLEVLRPAPVSQNGRLTGYRIMPGSNPALFSMTGLQAGDIVTQINGIKLNSNAASLRAMQVLANSGSAKLTVLRGGQVTSVQIAF